jgi:hypothetical protein
MSTFEAISILLGVISLSIAILAAVFSNHASKISMGALEIQLNQSITETKQEVINLQNDFIDLIAAFRQLSDNENKSFEKGSINAYKYEIFVKLFKSALENNLNDYEVACAKYLDKKIDKERFKRTYRVEIENLVKDKSLKDKFDHTSNYNAIKKVYEEWTNLEK